MNDIEDDLDHEIQFDEGPDHANLKFLPPYWFIAFFLLAVLCDIFFGISFLRWQIQIGVGLLLSGLGFMIFAFALHALNEGKTPASPDKPTLTIVTSGPYRFSRNPIYMSFTMLYLGVVILFDMVWGMLLIVPLMYCVIRFVIQPEESYLSRKFREEYASYCAKVRRWI